MIFQQLFIVFMSRCQIKHQLLANAVVHDEEIVFLTESYIKRSLKLEIRSKNVSLDCNVIFNIVRYSLAFQEVFVCLAHLGVIFSAMLH